MQKTFEIHLDKSSKPIEVVKALNHTEALKAFLGPIPPSVITYYCTSSSTDNPGLLIKIKDWSTIRTTFELMEKYKQDRKQII